MSSKECCLKIAPKRSLPDVNLLKISPGPWEKCVPLMPPVLSRGVLSEIMLEEAITIVHYSTTTTSEIQKPQLICSTKCSDKILRKLEQNCCDCNARCCDLWIVLTPKCGKRHHITLFFLTAAREARRLASRQLRPIHFWPEYTSDNAAVIKHSVHVLGNCIIDQLQYWPKHHLLINRIVSERDDCIYESYFSAGR